MRGSPVDSVTETVMRYNRVAKGLIQEWRDAMRCDAISDSPVWFACLLVCLASEMTCGDD